MSKHRAAAEWPGDQNFEDAGREAILRLAQAACGRTHPARLSHSMHRQKLRRIPEHGYTAVNFTVAASRLPGEYNALLQVEEVERLRGPTAATALSFLTPFESQLVPSTPVVQRVARWSYAVNSRAGTGWVRTCAGGLLVYRSEGDLRQRLRPLSVANTNFSTIDSGPATIDADPTEASHESAAQETAGAQLSDMPRVDLEIEAARFRRAFGMLNQLRLLEQ